MYIYNNAKNTKHEPRWLPYQRIFKKNGPVSYVVRDQMSGKLKRVHAQHLKPANLSKWYVPPKDPKIRKSRLAYAPSTHESDGDIGRASLAALFKIKLE